MRTLTHVSVSPTIVTGRLHERGGRGDGEPTIYIIVASSLGTHTFVFIGRRRGGKATDGIFGPVRPEILRWEDRISFYFAFTSFSSPSRHHFLAFLRRFFYHFSSRRYQEIHRARPQHPRHGFGNQGEWVTNVQQVDTRAPLCTRTLGDLKFRSIRRDTLSLSPSLPLSLSLSFSSHSCRRHGTRSMFPQGWLPPYATSEFDTLALIVPLPWIFTRVSRTYNFSRSNPRIANTDRITFKRPIIGDFDATIMYERTQLFYYIFFFSLFFFFFFSKVHFPRIEFHVLFTDWFSPPLHQRYDRALDNFHVIRKCRYT